jgi:hypothetical protein
LIQRECTSKFCGNVKAKNIALCNGENIKPEGVSGPLVSKIPVVLAETDVQIDLEADIKLKDDFYEIKRIKKDVFLTQCRLMPSAGRRDKCGHILSGKLFLEGYIQKNIEYATAKYCEKNVVSGKIKHTTVKVPFRCVTEVIYDTSPIIKYRSEVKKIQYFDDTVLHNNECEKHLKGKSNCEQDFEEIVYYTEKPFCELEQARIFESDINRKPIRIDGVTTFNKITEKLVLFLRIKVLQVQQVNIQNRPNLRCNEKEQKNEDNAPHC